MQLKDFFDRALVTSLSGALGRAYPAFDQESFIRAGVCGLDDLELIQRGAHIATVMRSHLPSDYRLAVDILLQALDFPSPTASSMAAFRYLPHTIFISSYGLDDFDTSMRAHFVLTQIFTSEFAIRPFLVRYPERTLEVIRHWANDPIEQVRRLASEGTRPRLPWGTRLPAFIADPTPVLDVLEMLRDDSSLSVRRSVANNLNDIAKDHPELVVSVCRRWLVDASPGRQWIVRHALRTLVKRGDRVALDLLGVGASPNVMLTDIQMPHRVRIGDKASLSFVLRGNSAIQQILEVDLVVHFVKSNGSTAAKVFKVRKVSLAANETIRLCRTVSFARMTTRTPYAGRHVLEAQINGVIFPLGSLDLGEDSPVLSLTTPESLRSKNPLRSN